MDPNFLEFLMESMGPRSAPTVQAQQPAVPRSRPASAPRVELSLNEDAEGDVSVLATALPRALLGKKFDIDVAGATVRFGTSKRSHYDAEHRKLYIDTTYSQAPGYMPRAMFVRCHEEMAALVRALNALIKVDEDGSVEVGGMMFRHQATPFDNAETVLLS